MRQSNRLKPKIRQSTVKFDENLVQGAKNAAVVAKPIEDDFESVEEEEAPVLPAPGAGAGGHHVESDQGPGSRHQVVVGQAVNHNLELPQLLLPSLKTERLEHSRMWLFTSCSLLSFSIVDILIASSWISFSAFLRSR